MWYRMRTSAMGDADFVASATELLRSTSGRLILLTSGGVLAWYFLTVIGMPDAVSLRLFPVTVVIILVGVASLQLLARSALAAQAIWQVGLAAAITLSVYLFQWSEIAFFFALLPLVAAVSIGWPGALLSTGLVTALVLGLAAGYAKVDLPPSFGAVIAVGAATAGGIGWTAARSLLTLTQWSLASFERAQEKVEEARDQRLELKQAQQDLILATSELARLSERLKAMHQVAEEARQAKEQFVANVSHELRTPLNMIIGFCEMITESPGLYGATLPPALLADIEVIQRNSHHLSKLVNDVLDLSQVQAGRMALSREWCRLGDLLAEAALAVRPLFDSKGLYLEMDVPADLPQVYCDSTRVRQVVLNLLSNAGRFTEKGGVQVQARSDGESLIVSIADTGPGIAPEDQKRLFEPFQQLDGSFRAHHEGSGLGLSISKMFVELHEGRMWLESTKGVGSTIYFTLPLVLSVPNLVEDDSRRWFSPYHQYAERTERSKAPPPAVRPRFVVLEQDRALSRMLARYVDGAEIVSVGDSQEAFAELARSPAVALVVNAGAHRETGALTHPLPGLPYDTPVITCWVATESETAKRLGVVRYLTKPVSREILLRSLAELGPGCKSVLVVDDEPDMLQLMARVLSGAGYQPLQAGDGQRALDLLRRRRPDAVLLDLIMPGVDGFQVLQEKSQDPAICDIPVVVISAKNPSGETIVSDSLLVSRGGGLSAQDLLGCLLAVSQVLSPPTTPGGRAQPESRASS